MPDPNERKKPGPRKTKRAGSITTQDLVVVFDATLEDASRIRDRCLKRAYMLEAMEFDCEDDTLRLSFAKVDIPAPPEFTKADKVAAKILGIDLTKPE